MFQRAIASIIMVMQNRAAIAALLLASAIILALIFITSGESINPRSLDAPNGQDVLNRANQESDVALEFREDRMQSRRVVPIIKDREEPSPDASPYLIPNESESDEGQNTWEDPVNQKVLGEKRWMAKPSDEEIARIESVLNQKRVDPEARAHRNQDRRTAIETIRVVVDQCVGDVREKHPEARGRVSVAFDFNTTGPVATIENGRIGQVWKLDEYPGFVTCVESGVTNLTFESKTEDTVMEVEYPFFYEGD